MHAIHEIIGAPTDSAGPDLISLEDLKLALGIAETDTSEDAALAAAITFQSRIIAEYCDRIFGLVEVMETFRFDRNEVLLARQALTLWQYPVVEIMEVSAAGATGDGYEFDPPSGRLWSVDGCWSGELIVTYTGGYDLPENAPARLQRAVIDAVNAGRIAAASGASTRDPAIREVQHGDTRVSYFTQSLASGSSSSSGYLSDTVLDLLTPFRRISVA